ncbi:conserved hypothetical protein [Vibrio chagasii]|uniref:hypothetical protein n=1 Tax=Vibrio chagasii TaxID=170679 RepID=UPI001EFE4C3E|nr:hypothetical protein [Vibrio chagasii]MCG9673289.1 hypothetical protein [Vibrio chagasii]CAH6830598.1 conserved hypothetical protein [Vibrio chagasii]CAH6879403.1 conserved hypothetical protein [Vibrio chagasii]CAH6966932.1 conserved hypothetical protein [Vibrio chagasii]CAH7004110.1 conserved hypothetical protein [Vibrio chagasii]
MTTFQYYFHQLPCFDCKKTTVSTDLGWLTPAMKEVVLAQLTETLAQGEITPDLTANVVCTKEEAREYLLLNFFGYSEEELEGEIEADDEQEVAEEIAELLEDGKDTIEFEHEVALQCCADCDIIEE